MSKETPKNIWVDEEMGTWAQYSEDENHYIRADIVDELVKALEGVIDAHADRVKELSFQQGIIVCDSRIAEAKAALAKARWEG